MCASSRVARMSDNKHDAAYPPHPALRFALTALVNARRKKLGLTTSSLAMHTGLPQSTWSRTLSGRCELTLDRAVAAAAYLETPLGHLFTDALILHRLMLEEGGRFASLTGANFLLEDPEIRGRMYTLQNDNVIVWVPGCGPTET
jgi:transcriptional regulator with XRE-family HTH domain